MRPTLKDISQSQKEVLEELASLHERIARCEGVCDHCAAIKAQETKLVKLVSRGGEKQELHRLAVFVFRHWKVVLGVVGFLFLWMREHSAAGIDQKQIDQLRKAVEWMVQNW